MADRAQLLQELQRRRDAGSFTSRQEAAYTELQKRGVFESAPPPVSHRTIAGVSNLKLPAQGDIDEELVKMAQANPETQFDFSNYGQSDPTGGRAQLPTLTPEQEKAAQRRLGTMPPDELKALSDSVLSKFGASTNLQRAAHDVVFEDSTQNREFKAREQQRRATEFERNVPRPLRPIASGLTQSTLSSAALIGQVTDAIGATENLATDLNEATARQSEERRSLGTTMFEDAAEGVTRSLVDLITVGRIIPAGGGSGWAGRLNAARGPIAAFTAKAMNDAHYQGQQAGLSGGDLAQYVLTQGAIEGGITSAFSMIGLGGFENAGAKEAGKQGLKEALKRVGIATLGELGEENLIGVLGAVSNQLQGVDPAALDAENLKQMVMETSLATLMTMGIAEGGTRAVEASRRRATQKGVDVRGVEQHIAAKEVRTLPESTPQAVPAATDLERRLTGTEGTRPAESALEQQLTGQQATDPTPAERDQFFGTGTTEASLIEQATFFSEKRAPDAQTTTAVDLETLSQQVAQADPDVGLDPEMAEPTAQFFAAQAKETLANPDDDYVLVDLPVSGIDINESYQPEQEESYAAQPAENAPPAMGGVHKDTGRFVLIDGNTRARAAKRRGDSTVKAFVPATDAKKFGLNGAPQARGPRRRKPSKVYPQGFDERQFVEDQDRRQAKAPVPNEQRTGGDRRSPDLAAARAEISRLYASGQTEAAEARIAELQDKARRDPKGTGMLSGTAFDATLADIKQDVDEGSPPRQIAMFDVANLGLDNTVRGHQQADADLNRIAQAVIGVVGPDNVYRTGGDEITVIFPDNVSRPQAHKMLRDIEEAVGFDQIVPGVSMFLVGQVGTVTKDRSVKDLLDRIEHQAEAKKRAIKESRGEPTTVSKDEARHMAEAGMRKTSKAPAANKAVGRAAQEYAEDNGIENIEHEPKPINTLTARKLARAYEDLEHNPDDPRVKESYDALKRETLDQFNALKARGYVFEVWDKPGQPYATVAEMAKDVAENRHLYYFPTDAGFGDTDTDRSDHPMLEPAPGTGGLLHNDVFRIVHDFYGHAKDGYGFDVAGEENAWRSHSQMYSEVARGAMTTETRGQSTWVGYGPHGKENAKKIEQDNIGEVVFADQKAGLLPVEFWSAPGLKPIGEVAEQPQKKRVMGRARKGAKSAKKATPIKGTKHKRRVPQGVEDWITPISSRIRDLAPRIFDRLMRMEFRTNAARERLKKELHDPAARITKVLGGKKSKRYREFKQALLNGDRDAAMALLPEAQHADLDQFYTTFRNLLDNMREAGITIGDLGPNYWARFLKDYEGFRKVYGPDTGLFEEAWDVARAVKGRAVLSSAEKAEIANSVLQGYGPRKPGSTGISNARERSIDEIPDSALDFYVDPLEAAFRYVDGAIYAAERSRFLGRKHAIDNLDDTIGRIVQEEVDAGVLNRDQQDELRDLLTARFVADINPTGRTVRAIKQFIYLISLAQFRSSVTQLTDLAFTGTTWSIPASLQGAGTSLRLTGRDRRIAMEDIGIHDHGEEFKDVGRLARAVDWSLRKTGFKAMDRLGKETRINAALRDLQRVAAGARPAHYNRLKRDYAPVLGADVFNQVMADLRAGRTTEDTKYLLFLDISKVQPLTLSQMPKKYLDMPNGRIIYTLKTFTVMQLDFVRRDMIRKLLTPGQRAEGARNLGRYMVLFTLLGLGVDWIKDWIKGKPTSADQLPDRSVDAVLGAVGLNRYTTEKAWTNPSEAALNYVAPPMSWIDSGWNDVKKLYPRDEGTGGKAKPGLRTVRYLPLIGELVYYWAPFGRGNSLTEEEAKKDYRSKLKELRSQAGRALEDGDLAMARQLLTVYNDRRKEGPGDGRTRPLTIQNLRGDIQRRNQRRDSENE